MAIVFPKAFRLSDPMVCESLITIHYGEILLTEQPYEVVGVWGSQTLEAQARRLAYLRGVAIARLSSCLYTYMI